MFTILYNLVSSGNEVEISHGRENYYYFKSDAGPEARHCNQSNVQFQLSYHGKRAPELFALESNSRAFPFSGGLAMLAQKCESEAQFWFLHFNRRAKFWY